VGSVLYPIESEFETLQTLHLAQSLVEYIERARRIVILANQRKFNSGAFDASFSVGNSKDHYTVTPLLEAACQRGQWVDVTSPRKTKYADPCHALLHRHLMKELRSQCAR
jgi:hypothetical protein